MPRAAAKPELVCGPAHFAVLVRGVMAYNAPRACIFDHMLTSRAMLLPAPAQSYSLTTTMLR